jgi:hypothetical protein
MNDDVDNDLTPGRLAQSMGSREHWTLDGRFLSRPSITRPFKAEPASGTRSDRALMRL